jgi:hypothetical protein
MDLAERVVIATRLQPTRPLNLLPLQLDRGSNAAMEVLQQACWEQRPQKMRAADHTIDDSPTEQVAQFQQMVQSQGA